MLALGDGLPNFRVDLGKLEATAQLVIDTTHAAYPTLDVPFHSRWRHFDIDGFDYWNEIDQAMAWPSPAERSRTAMDLAIISVLLDAGAGPNWRFLYEVSGEYVSRYAFRLDRNSEQLRGLDGLGHGDHGGHPARRGAYPHVI